jgi:flavorubredoxin
MTTRVDEIAEDVFRISTHRPDGGGAGIVYNQFLIRGEAPLLVHTGMRTIYPQTAAALARLIDVRSLRWITGGHASRPDEFGAAEQLLEAAPTAQVVAGRVAVGVCLRHMIEGPVAPIASGEALDLGGGRMARFIATPHVPFWEAGVWLLEPGGVLLCGDLFTMEGNPPPVSDRDILGPALAFEARMRHFTVSDRLAPTLRRLAGLEPRMLACMHGPAFTGDCAGTLAALAGHYERERA